MSEPYEKKQIAIVSGGFGGGFFAQWTWSYLTFKRGARLITGKEWREPRPR